MIGDHDGVGAALRGELRILDVEDALEHERPAPEALYPFDVFPRERGIELPGDPLRERGEAVGARDAALEVAEAFALARHHVQRPAGLSQDVEHRAPREARRHCQSVFQIAMALPLDLQVERQHEGGTARCLRALDERRGEAPVAHHVELEPEGLAGGLRHVLERADRHRRERERDAEMVRRARGEDFAVRPVQAKEPDRCERHRHGDRPAEQGRRGGAPVDIDADALAQPDRLDVGLVGAQRALGVRAAVDVLEDRARHAFSRQLAQILDAGHHGHGGAFYNAEWRCRGRRRRIRSR